MKQNKGITLITLIITVIVLLILAGVAINMVIGEDGLINKAKMSAETYEIEGIKEKIQISIAESYMNSDDKKSKIDKIIEALEDNQDNSFNLTDIDKLDDNTVKIVVNGKYIFEIDAGEGINYLGLNEPQDLELSRKSGTYTYPTSGTFEVTRNVSGGKLSVSSSNNAIATASISENTVTVTPGATPGKAIITVTSTAGNNVKTANYEATVYGEIILSATPYVGTYDGTTHDAITGVTVMPSDALIEYSTDGTNFSSTIPKITDTSSFTVTLRATKDGYMTKTATYTTTVNQETEVLTLSSTSGTVRYPTTSTFTIIGNIVGARFTVSSSDETLATANLDGNTIILTPQKDEAGIVTITVKRIGDKNYTEETATYTLNVKENIKLGDRISLSVDGYSYNWVVLEENETKVTLLCDKVTHNASWYNADSKANQFAKKIDSNATGRILTLAEAKGIASRYLSCSSPYWLHDRKDSGNVWFVSKGAIQSHNNPDSTGGGVRPVIVISKDKLE